MTDLFFEDFQAGDTSSFGACEVTAEMIVAFARDYDPQAFHLDEALARDTFVGRLIASGWHTCALQMRMICDAWLLRASSMGGPGIDELKWLRPVLPGDVLSVRQTILDTKLSRTRPSMGLVQFLLETLNGAGETVMTQTMWVMLGRRRAAAEEDGEPAGVAPSPVSRSGTQTSRPPPSVSIGMPPGRDFDAIEIGQTERLGQHLFAAADIVQFARTYDPQPFHVDEEAACASHFGGLVASGWHTAACWMRALVDHRTVIRTQCEATGRPSPRFGSSPGFRNLRWLKPVRAGDTVAYSTQVIDKRVSASRAGWGLVFNRATGTNQDGEVVFSVDGSVFCARGDAT